MARTLASVCAAIRRGRRRQLQSRLEPGRQRVLAVHAETQAGERDAELRGRDESILIDRRRQQARARAAAIESPWFARCSTAVRDTPMIGELRGHEERVGQQKPERDERRPSRRCALDVEKLRRARPEW